MNYAGSVKDSSAHKDINEVSRSEEKSKKIRRSATMRSISRRWTDAECAAVLGAFKETAKAGKMPTGEQIKKLINDNDCLKGRGVAQLRTWLHCNKNKDFQQLD